MLLCCVCDVYVIVLGDSEACGRGRVKEALTPLLADMQVTSTTISTRQSHIETKRETRTRHHVMSMERP